MKTKVFFKTILICAIISVMVFIALPGTVLAMSANDPPEGISLGEWQKMQAQIRKAQYHFTADDADKAETYSANNRRHGFMAKFGKDAVEIIPKDSVSNQTWNFRLSVSSYGYGRYLKPVQAAEIAADKNRLEYRRGDLTEWYVNDENGMEQGFTIMKPPLSQNVGISPRTEGNHGGLPLRIEMKADTGLCPELSQDRQSVNFTDVSGQTLLSYHKLAVSDADNRKIPAHFETSGNVLYISVDDRDAKYPLTIDPFISLVATETQKLSRYFVKPGDEFGNSVFISGNILIIGAPTDDNSGSAYIFYNNQGSANNWVLIRKIKASDVQTGDYFGQSVSVSGDIVVVGAWGSSDSGINSGAAYIFSRHQGGIDNWGQVKKITASDAAAGDWFGYSVSVSGDIVVVGANGNDEKGSSSGAAYIFSRNQDGNDNWGQVKKITASDAVAGGYFGHSVSVSGDTIVVGAWGSSDSGTNSGSAYIFSKNQGGMDNWGQVQKITASDPTANGHFGSSVSVGGDIIAVGANGGGAAYIFYRNEGVSDNWGQVKKLTAWDYSPGNNFGRSISVSGNIIVAGAISNYPNSGAAYVFSKNQGGTDNWGAVRKITASDPTTGDWFGHSVSTNGDIIVVGTYYHNSSSPDKSHSGSAYMFSISQGNWTGAKITPSDIAVNDQFGWSVSASGDIIVVGTLGDDDGGSQSGSAYIFYRNQGGQENWGMVKKIRALIPEANMLFGSSVSVSGDIIVVGAYGNYKGVSNSGSVYIFSRNQGGQENWGMVRIYYASTANQYFGSSVSVSGDIIVVGTRYVSASGSAYILSRNQGGQDKWGLVKTIKASDSAAGDLFGSSVSVSGDIIVAGARWSNSGDTYSGSAYIFSRNQGGNDNWGQVKKITAAPPTAYDMFGSSVSVSGDIIVVGAYVTGNNKAGSAYIFSRNQGGNDNWGQIKKITASDATADDNFGSSVSVSGDIIAVGAYGNNSSTGSAYTFYRNQGWQESWGLSEKITASANAGDNLGYSVSVSGNTLVVGAYGESIGSLAGSGAAYIYDLSVAPYVVSILPNNSVNTSSSENFIVTFSGPVNGIDTTDFALSSTDTAVGTISSVTPLSATEDAYTVTVTGIIGKGSLSLNLQDNDSITNSKGLPLGGTGTGNGNFTGDSLFVVPTADTTAVKQKKAIIVAGGGTGYSGDYLWTSTKFCTDQANTALLFQGYDPSNIRYLAAGTSDDLKNLETAIKTWAADKTSGGYDVTDLLIYMTGHGTSGQFTLTGNPNTTLNADVLKGWLDELQDTTGMSVILIYDACYAGSFIAGLGKDAGKTYDRILIASTAQNQIALFGDNGKLSFSVPFWNSVMTHGMLNGSFASAVSGIANMKLTQIPQIMGMPANDLKIGLGLQKASLINIGTISPNVTLTCNQTSADVSVSNISASNQIFNVQADIQYYSDPNAVTENPETGLALSDSETSGVFKRSFDNLTKAGTYHVCVQATDLNNKKSAYHCTTITKASCIGMNGDLNGSGAPDLADAIIALRVLSGINVSVSLSADVNGDGNIGIEEVIYILQFVAGLR